MLQYILALITILVFVILIFRKPQIETYVVYVLTALPLMETKILPLEYGFIRAFDVVTGIAFILFVKDFFSFKSKEKRWFYCVLIVLFCALTLLSNINAEFGFTNAYLIYPIFTIFIFTRFLILYNIEEPNLPKTIKAFKWGFVSALVFMALQIVIGLQFTFYENLSSNVFNESADLTRYPGIMLDSQRNGQFLALGTFILLVLNQKVKPKRKYLNYLGFAVSILFVFLAGSRSALGGLGVGLFILFLAMDKRVKTYGLTAALLALGLYFFVSPEKGIFSRTESIGDDLDFRQAIWEETYDIIEKHPFLGIGTGNYQPYITKYHQNLYLELSPAKFFYFYQPENGYLKILVEQGSFCFGIFLLLIVVPMTKVANGLIKNSVHPNALFYIASLCSWLVAFNTVYTLVDYRILILVGLCITKLILYSRNDSIQE